MTLHVAVVTEPGAVFTSLPAEAGATARFSFDVDEWSEPTQ